MSMRTLPEPEHRNDSPFTAGELRSVYDQPQQCPYLPQQIARMPLQWPTRSLNGEQLDWLMAAGYRRSGAFIYHTACESCVACEPTRLDVDQFHWSGSFKRVLNRGNRHLEVKLSPPQVTPEKLALLNSHRSERNLSLDGKALDALEFSSFLVDTCCETFEFQYFLDGELVAVAVTDFGACCLSAVYCYFSPRFSRFSLGTYSILKQIEFAKASGRRHVYLGMYVAENQHLNYKARFLPQERFVKSHWMPFA